MNLDSYTDWTDAVWKGEPLATTTDRDIAIAALGLAGEAGEVVEFFKKHLRDRKVIVGNEDLKLELGDMFFYWARLVRIAGFTPDDVIAANVAKLASRYAGRRDLPPVAA